MDMADASFRLKWTENSIHEIGLHCQSVESTIEAWNTEKQCPYLYFDMGIL